MFMIPFVTILCTFFIKRFFRKFYCMLQAAKIHEQSNM